MKDLLALAIESHGGQARWDAIRTVTAELSIGGALWATPMTRLDESA
jgi:hypothetical protein